MLRVVVALLLLMPGAGAMAQDEQPLEQPTPSTDASPMDAPEDPANGMTESGPIAPPITVQEYIPTPTDSLATRLIGADVHVSADPDAEVIGTITDLVVGETGNVAAVVVSVGGFLGIGEKNVAIDYRQMQQTTDSDGEALFIIPATDEGLSAAADFVWDDTARDQANLEESQVDDTGNTVAVDPALTTDQPDQPLDRDTMTGVDFTTLRAAQLLGTAVYGINDEQIGSIGDIIFTPEGSVDAVLVDVGGFLGIGQKEVAVGFENLAFATDINGVYYLFLNISREELEAQPAFDQATYADDRDSQRLIIRP